MKYNVALLALAGAALAKVQYAGINIAGCDFGCSTDGTCSGSYCPTNTGPTQMSHFVKDDKFNTFRLPVGWQYLVKNNVASTSLDATYFAEFDSVVQTCLKTGAACIIDVHNYARWNGQIVGQSSAVTDQNFASLWKLLAQKYASQSKVIFGLMNEPHDLDMTKWAASVQAAVTAIRQAGATSQTILLPGTGYTSAGGFEKNSAPFLAGVKNPDGSTRGLVYDIHRYFDSDGSGTNAECVQDHISDSFAPLATYLRQNKRQAFLSEFGGGNTDSCVRHVCNALDYLNSNADVFVGYTGWAAGNFDQSYVLSEVPNGSTDTKLVQSCVAGKWK